MLSISTEIFPYCLLSSVRFKMVVILLLLVSIFEVITSASAVEQRQIIHTPFERVEDFYIPPTNLIITHVRYAMVVTAQCA